QSWTLRRWSAEPEESAHVGSAKGYRFDTAIDLRRFSDLRPGDWPMQVIRTFQHVIGRIQRPGNGDGIGPESGLQGGRIHHSLDRNGVVALERVEYGRAAGGQVGQSSGHDRAHYDGSRSLSSAGDITEVGEYDAVPGQHIAAGGGGDKIDT